MPWSYDLPQITLFCLETFSFLKIELKCRHFLCKVVPLRYFSVPRKESCSLLSAHSFIIVVSLCQENDLLIYDFIRLWGPGARNQVLSICVCCVLWVVSECLLVKLLSPVLLRCSSLIGSRRRDVYQK